jgi:ATP-binding cassette subfamily F protein 3
MQPIELIKINNLSKSYGSKILFDQANLIVLNKKKTGVIGRNGAGKSTLFKMILESEDIDSGEIIKSDKLRIGYIQQTDPFLKTDIVLEFLISYTKREEHECQKMASKFGLTRSQLDGSFENLSGGYQMRVKLVAMLLFEPNLLLLDEPTNYLDLSTLILLENFLKNYKEGFLLITHDREFVKNTCTSIIDVDDSKLYFHDEGLEEYLEFKDEKKALAQSVNLNIERKQKQLKTFVDRFGAKATMAKSAQSKLKQITKLEGKKIEIVNPFKTASMRIKSVTQKGGLLFSSKDLSIGYPNKVIANKINFEINYGQKVAILGDNGQGKSTLLKTLGGKIDPISGEMKFYSTPKIAFYDQHVHHKLDMSETVWNYATRNSARSSDQEIFQILGEFLFVKDDYVKNISVLSGGEKARLVMAIMFLSGAEVFMLDEPTNHLDFETVENLAVAIKKFNGTVILISHDRTFVSLSCDEIIEVKNGNVKKIFGNYEDYVWRIRNEFEQITALDQPKEDFQKPTSSNKQRFELGKKLRNMQKKIDEYEQNKNLLNANELEKLADYQEKWLELSLEMESL